MNPLKIELNIENNFVELIIGRKDSLYFFDIGKNGKKIDTKFIESFIEIANKMKKYNKEAR